MFRIFCFFGIHNWKMKKEKYLCENHPNNRKEVRAIVRECKWCGHREHHLLPRQKKKFTNWENWDKIKEGDTINYSQL